MLLFFWHYYKNVALAENKLDYLHVENLIEVLREADPRERTKLNNPSYKLSDETEVILCFLCASEFRTEMQSISLRKLFTCAHKLCVDCANLQLHNCPVCGQTSATAAKSFMHWHDSSSLTLINF